MSEQVAEVLAAHREDGTYPDTCVCETEVPDRGSEGHYVAHVAAMLAPLIAERERAAAERAARDQRRYESIAETLHTAVLRAEAAEGAVARVEAVAARWEREVLERDPFDEIFTDGAAAMIRAALAPEPTDDVAGAQRGGEGA